MIKVNKNLALFSALFLLLGTIFLLAVQKFTPLLGHVTYYCQSFIETNMIQIPYYLSLIPVALLSLILAVSFVKFIILTIKMRFLKHALKGKSVVRSKVSKIIKSCGLEQQAVIIKSNKKFAFCLGIRNPKIYISTGLISKLSLKEIEAVIRHEQYHLENHDTFTMVIASFTHSLFPFFPLIGDLERKYRVEREIEADRFAVKKVGNSDSLLKALKKLLLFPTIEPAVVAAIADQDTLEPRIYSLINKPYTSRLFRVRSILITLLFSLLIGTILAIPIHAKEIHHEEHDVMMLCANGSQCMTSCASKETMSRLYSEMPITIVQQNASHSYTPAQ